jgi:hypothetical protein
MDDQSLQWGAHDAWILLAVAMGDRESGGSLRDLIAVADDADHAVPSYEDLARALEHLTQAGLVLVDDRRYRLTSEGARVADAVAGPLPSGREKMSALQQHLDGHPPLAVAEPVRIPEAEYEHACAEYLGAFG